MTLPKIFWHRYRCGICGRVFELPPDTVVLPPHESLRRDATTRCAGRDPVPA